MRDAAELSKIILRPEDIPLTPLFHAVAGGVGGMLALLTTYPLDIFKTRVQASSSTIKDFENDGFFQALQHIYKEEGVGGVYRGLSSGLIATLVNQFVYFYFYETLKPPYERVAGGQLGPILQLLLGTHAAALNSVTTLPITVVNTRIQTTKGKPAGINTTILDIIKKDGFTTLWTGLGPSLVLCINPAITFLVFEKLKQWIEKRGGKGSSPTVFQIFLIGAVAKTTATILTYPFIISKVRLQAQRGETTTNGKKTSTSTGIADALREIYKEGGFAGLYKGMQPQIIKAVLTQAILFMLKEEIIVATRHLLFYLLHARASALSSKKRP